MVFALHGFAGKPGTTFFRQFHCRKHCFRRTRLYCSNCGEFVGAERITGLICGRQSGGCESASIFHGTRSTPRQGDKRQRRSRLNRVARTVARPKEVPLGEGGSHKARPVSCHHYPQGIQGAANRGPAKAQRSGFGGERRSSGTTELLPRKAKRRMWSLRRRDASFSTIFLQTKKDRVPEGRSEKRMPVKP